jgi:glycosyltransferase involved in cell wall biosynthesis
LKPEFIGGVSVVIPTYNCERYIRQTLDSVLQQSLPPAEVLVIDDGSTDETVAIANGYGAPVRVVQQANQGVCVARNRGFEESSGEFVAFLDHDDYWYPWKLERQVEAFRRHQDVGVVYAGFLNWRARDGHFPAPEVMCAPQTGPLVVNQEYSGWIYHHLLITCWALTSTALIRRSVFASMRGFDVELPFAEEWDLWLRISRLHQFLKLDEVSTLYRQHENQGNRKVRTIDYRTRLLTQAVAKWGLASPDGRATPQRAFDARLARYHQEFGLNHLAGGDRGIAMRSLLQAWRLQPLRLRYLAVLVAAAGGWRPDTATA